MTALHRDRFITTKPHPPNLYYRKLDHSPPEVGVKILEVEDLIGRVKLFNKELFSKLLFANCLLPVPENDHDSPFRG